MTSRLWTIILAHVQPGGGDDVELLGTPARGLTTATVGFFAGLTMIVSYGVAGPYFAESFELSGWQLGALLSSPHISKAVLRIPFGAWVDSTGGRTPLLILLVLSVLGLAGVTSTLFFVDAEALDDRYFLLFLVFVSSAEQAARPSRSAQRRPRIGFHCAGRAGRSAFTPVWGISDQGSSIW